jgi:hypothetical protein
MYIHKVPQRDKSARRSTHEHFGSFVCGGVTTCHCHAQLCPKLADQHPQVSVTVLRALAEEFQLACIFVGDSTNSPNLIKKTSIEWSWLQIIRPQRTSIRLWNIAVSVLICVGNQLFEVLLPAVLVGRLDIPSQFSLVYKSLQLSLSLRSQLAFLLVKTLFSEPLRKCRIFCSSNYQ